MQRSSFLLSLLSLSYLAASAATGCASSHVASNSPPGDDSASTAPATPPAALDAAARTITAAAVPLDAGTSAAPAAATGTPHDQYVAFLKARVPAGDEVVDHGDSDPVEVLHTIPRGEIPATLAHAYQPLSDVYFEDDYTNEINKSARKEGGFIPGHKIHIPHLWSAPFKTADDERLGWPDDKVIRGLYIRGGTAVRPFFAFILDQMVKHDINAIVLDGKDYDGPVTYASKAPLALETHAAKGAPIRDLSRVIRFVHQKGIRVILRVACFNDEFMSKAKPELSVWSKWDKPYPIGWLDPNNTGAQDYILSLVQEGVDAGADEIELDYVRYPVLGIKGADFKLDETKRTKIDVIRDFVRRAHTVTAAHKVPLSLDLFGVIAQGRRIDIDMLGQDMAVLAPEVEAFSPMVYPSHYSPGFYGWPNPGDHPEIVGIGVKGSLEQIKQADQSKPLAVVRPWIQAEDYKTTNYSPQYLKDEIRTSNENGGTGWLMWNPSQEYAFAWAAVPMKAETASAPAKSADGAKATK